MAETVIFKNIPGSPVEYFFAADAIEVPAGAIAGDVLTVVDIGGGVLRIGADAGGGGSTDADTLDGLDSTAFVLVTQIGVANGVAPLGVDGKVPAAFLPTMSLLRTTSTIIAADVAPSGQATGAFALAKASILLRAIAIFNRQCRIRLYGTSAARDADVARARDVSAISGSTPTGTGIATDLVLSANEAYDIMCEPKPILANFGSPAITSIYWTIDNLTTGTVTVAVTLHHIPVEA